MNRYARTKDDVYQILRETKISDTCIRYDVKPNKKLEYHIFSENIIKESNNLEDLIDGYVVKKIFTDKDYVDYSFWFQDFKRAKIKKESYRKQGIETTIYGAIWTDNGLIYAAEMNKDGEMELK